METNPVKDKLTAEQSKHLISLGVPKSLASELQEWDDDVSKWTHRGDPIFTLTNLLGILPKEIDEEWTTFYFTITTWEGKWDVNYYSKSAETYLTSIPDKEELIDAVYELLCWYLERNRNKVNTP